MSHLFAGLCGAALMLAGIALLHRFIPAAVVGLTAAILSGLVARSFKREGR